MFSLQHNATPTFNKILFVIFKFPLAFIVSFYADDSILSMTKFSENQALLQLWISFLPS